MDAAYFFQILGITGSLIMCASSVPQIIKTYRMKCADNLSGSYLLILITGMLLILS
ncbi:MAG: PQ-loop repeat-containing protein [Smithella sp.]